MRYGQPDRQEAGQLDHASLNLPHGPEAMHGAALTLSCFNTNSQRSQENEKQSAQRVKMFQCIMDSMTDKELDSTNPKLMEAPSRIQRIARGSGRHPQEVVMLLGALGCCAVCALLTLSARACSVLLHCSAAQLSGWQVAC